MASLSPATKQQHVIPSRSLPPGMIYGGTAHLTPAAIGFEVPGLNIEPGLEIALDVAVCDDDGKGRKSLLIWSGVNNEYWLSPVTKLMTVRD